MEFVFRLDYDNKTYGQIKRYIEVMLEIGKSRIKTIRSRRSAGGCGFHLEVTMQIPDSILKQIKNPDCFMLGIRYTLMDCYGRIKGDIARLTLNKRVDRLADYKDGRYAQEWKTEYDAGIV